MIMIRFFVIACLAFALNFGCAQKKMIDTKKTSERCLEHQFGKDYPYVFKFYNDKIIIGDGRRLISFDKSGKEISKIIIPTTFRDGGQFLDFLPLSDSSYLVTIHTDLCMVTAKTQKLLSPKFGELIRGELPIVAGNFQDTDTASNTINGVRLFDFRTNHVFTYPTKRNLGTYNFEILNGEIVMCTPDHAFCLLPIDSTSETKAFEVPFEGIYSFLGMSQGNFVLSTRDHDKKEDHLHFYDSNMVLVKEAILDVSYAEISDLVKESNNFYIEAPFGNFYTFDKKTETIYVFRHTKKNGICYSPIENHLKVISKE